LHSCRFVRRQLTEVISRCKSIIDITLIMRRARTVCCVDRISRTTWTTIVRAVDAKRRVPVPKCRVNGSGCSGNEKVRKIENALPYFSAGRGSRREDRNRCKSARARVAPPCGELGQEIQNTWYAQVRRGPRKETVARDGAAPLSAPRIPPRMSPKPAPPPPKFRGKLSSGPSSITYL
jgi:hypothetical protein